MDNEQPSEAKIMIDDFIHKISGQSIVETSVVIDHLLDIRNAIELATAPV